MPGLLPSGYGPNIISLDEIAFITSEGTQITFPPRDPTAPPSFAERQEGSVDAATGTHIMICGADGKVTVEPKLGRALEAKKAPGKHKERLYDRGLKKAEIRVTLTSWTQEGHNQLEKVIDLLKLRALPKARKPIGVRYPTLSVLGIEYIVCKELSSFKPGELHGSMELVIEFYEWNKEPRPKVPRQLVTAAPATPPALFEPFAGTNRNASATQFNANTNPFGGPTF